MKKYKLNMMRGLAILASAALITSCAKAPEPQFTWDPEYPEAGEEVQFENLTEDATDFEWNFGDNSTGSIEHPSHIFSETGTYTVTLTATNDAGEATIEELITVNDPTQLGFTLIDTLLQPLEGATVMLYDDEDDWNNISDPINALNSDVNGEVLFSPVEPAKHWIWVIREDIEGYWVSGGYTGELVKNETTYYTVPCEWYLYEDATKSTREMILETVKAISLEKR